MERTLFPDPEQHRLASVIVLNAMLWDRAVADWMRERSWFTAASGQPELPFEPSLAGFAYVVWDFDTQHPEDLPDGVRATAISRHAHDKAVQWRQWTREAAQAIRAGEQPPPEPAPRDFSVPAHIRRHNQGLSSMATMSAGGTLTGVIAPEPATMTQTEAWSICQQYGQACVSEARDLRLTQQRALAAELALEADLDRRRRDDPVWEQTTTSDHSVTFSGPAR
ncbi:hypothetical protein GCM10010401_08650 [Rarobacter faecitabidus]|uniref:Uncharacterized protein n=1 Tax=Rarobacter faecitabidus TaxID=13243 RepID=A0A542ZAY4_RARFA|nr:hypothetical protein [Rarobacter faecitabidus]TQL57466.1 hypothetical protein FB461_2203 [Rarobacter faecitabidus]